MSAGFWAIVVWTGASALVLLLLLGCVVVCRHAVKEQQPAQEEALRPDLGAAPLRPDLRAALSRMSEAEVQPLEEAWPGGSTAEFVDFLGELSPSLPWRVGAALARCCECEGRVTREAFVAAVAVARGTDALALLIDLAPRPGYDIAQLTADVVNTRSSKPLLTAEEVRSRLLVPAAPGANKALSASFAEKADSSWVEALVAITLCLDPFAERRLFRPLEAESVDLASVDLATRLFDCLRGLGKLDAATMSREFGCALGDDEPAALRLFYSLAKRRGFTYQVEVDGVAKCLSGDAALKAGLEPERLREAVDWLVYVEHALRAPTKEQEALLLLSSLRSVLQPAMGGDPQRRQPGKEGAQWSLIPTDWLAQWLDYVSGSRELAEGLGVLAMGGSERPGRIDTSVLLVGNGRGHFTLRHDLKYKTHFTVVRRKAWDAFVTWYGLAPGSHPIERLVVETSNGTLQLEMHPSFAECFLGATQEAVLIRCSPQEPLALVKQRACAALLGPGGDPRDLKMWLGGPQSLERWSLENNLEHSLDLVLQSIPGTKFSEELFSITLERPSSGGGAPAFKGTDIMAKVAEETTPVKLPASVGSVGLRNLGNSCYLNATLQALVHLPGWREYFASGEYEYDLNTQGSMNGGKLACTFGKLVQEMVSVAEEEAPVVEPRMMKRVLGLYEPRFNGSSEQHDAAELLGKFLEGLGEDLNRVKDAFEPFFEDDSTDDANLAKRSWACHLAREDHPVSSCFVGLLRHEMKSDIDVRRVSFEPFTSLNVPLPTETKRFLKVRLHSRGEPTVDVTVRVDDELCLTSLLGQLARENTNLSDLVAMRNFAILPGNFRVSLLSDLDVFEAASPLCCRLAGRTDSFVLSVVKGTNAEVHAAVAEKLQGDFFTLLRVRKQVGGGRVERGLGPIRSDLEVPKGSLEWEALKVPNDDAPFEMEGTAGLIIDGISQAMLPPPVQQHESVERCSLEAKRTLELAECLEQIAAEEKVASSTNEWVKRTTLWTAPRTLVLTLRRFQVDPASGALSKLQQLVNFPVTEPLTLPAAAFTGANDEPATYDLCAVVNHVGSLRGGHYTCFARSLEDASQWLELNDSKVRVLKDPQKEVVTAGAYVLLWTRRDSGSIRDHFPRVNEKPADVEAIAKEPWGRPAVAKSRSMVSCMPKKKKKKKKRYGPSKAARAAAAARHAPDVENQRRILPRFEHFARIYAAASFPGKKPKIHTDE